MEWYGAEMIASPIRILTRAKWIMEHHDFCLYHDPDRKYDGVARRADGLTISAHSKIAAQFTLTGAVAKAVCDVTGEDWIVRHDDYAAAMRPLHERVSFNHMRFLRICDQMGKEKCIKLLEEVLTI